VLVAAKQTPVRSVRGRSIGVRSWPIWELPDWLVAFVTIVVLADVAVLGVAASALTFHAHHLWLFAGLLVCDALTVELTRRVGENTGMVKDVYATWELPAAILLPMVYVPLLPIVRFALSASAAGHKKALAFVNERRKEDPERVRDIEQLLELEKPAKPDPKQDQPKK